MKSTISGPVCVSVEQLVENATPFVYIFYFIFYYINIIRVRFLLFLVFLFSFANVIISRGIIPEGQHLCYRYCSFKNYLLPHIIILTFSIHNKHNIVIVCVPLFFFVFLLNFFIINLFTCCM